MASSDTETSTVLHSWTVPGTEPGESTTVVAKPGRVSLFLGANGAGKSALGYWMRTQLPDTQVVHLRANRQLWFASSGPTTAPAQRGNVANNLANQERQQDARWIDRSAASAIEIALLDLVIATNRRDQEVAYLVEHESSLEDVRAKSSERPVDALNRVFQSAGFELVFELNPDSNFSVTKSTSSYPIFQMSDGEKSALFLAARVLTAPSNAVVILDEPERHLHRSVSARLIEAIVTERSDCHVVLLTHDLDLAGSLRRDLTATYVVSGCRVGTSGSGEAWEINPVDADGALPVEIRRAILGGRKRILFVEGAPQSLDMRLYSLLYPDWLVQPSGGCEQVLRCVEGLRSSDPHHWVDARGVVDRDGRSDSEAAALRDDSVVVLPVSEIESLFYVEAVLSSVAEAQEHSLGEPSGTLLTVAKSQALQALAAANTRDHLAASVAEKRLGRSIAAALPGRDALKAQPSPMSLTVEHEYSAIRSRLDHLLAQESYDDVVKEFPIRDSGFRKAVAIALRFSNSESYEAAAFVRMRVDLRQHLLRFVEGR